MPKRKKKNDLQYYSVDKIKEKNAKYNIIFGERSNGKSYALKKECIDNLLNNGKQFAIVRRALEDFRYQRGATYFNDIISDGYIKNKFPIFDDPEGRYYNNIQYKSMRYYLTRFDYETGKTIWSPEPIGYCFALSSFEHDKSTSYPDITTVVFEEFITRSMYYTDEFVIFQNVLSTIIRQRTDVTIWMLGNTVNQYCPYFEEMGLTKIKQQEKGTIVLYKYGDSGLTVAVEYADSVSKEGKPSDVYFAFGNSKLKMITEGDWEIDIYPHLPMKYVPRDIRYTFFIEFKAELLQAEVIKKDGTQFVYIHRKTTPIKKDNDIVFSTNHNVSKYYNKNILKPTTQRHKIIAGLLTNDNTFYQDNTVGEVMRNYLLWCKS